MLVGELEAFSLFVIERRFVFILNSSIQKKKFGEGAFLLSGLEFISDFLSGQQNIISTPSFDSVSWVNWGFILAWLEVYWDCLNLTPSAPLSHEGGTPHIPSPEWAHLATFPNK